MKSWLVHAALGVALIAQANAGHAQSAGALTGALGKPGRLLVGLGAGNPVATMNSQGIRPDILDTYLVGVGSGQWPSWNSPSGSYVTATAAQADTLGAVPMYTLYQMATNGDGNITDIGDATFMTAYWSQVRLMYQKIGAYGKPTLVNLEPDFWGYVEGKAPNGDPTQLYAYVNGVAAALGKPAIGIHHLEGHLLSPFLGPDAPQFPFVALLVSGGHTQLMQVDGVGRYQLLGETIDDAAGEAFDKSAKLLGLGYPGGPALARLADLGDPQAFALPRPLLHSGNLDFSFAGLKTAVMTQARKLGPQIGAQAQADLAASTQAAIVDVLVAKTLRALKDSGLKGLVVAGGVGANLRLREKLDAGAARLGVRVHYPPLALCTDNGAMIALAAAMRLQEGLAEVETGGAFDVRPRWPLDELSARPAPAALS